MPAEPERSLPCSQKLDPGARSVPNPLHMLTPSLIYILIIFTYLHLALPTGLLPSGYEATSFYSHLISSFRNARPNCPTSLKALFCALWLLLPCTFLIDHCSHTPHTSVLVLRRRTEVDISRSVLIPADYLAATAFNCLANKI
jgi:hypothetical protein